jgi:hypothetical protein
MPNMPHQWRDRDAKRALRVVAAAGLNPVALEVDPLTGRITVKVGKSEAPANEPEPPEDIVL